MEFQEQENAKQVDAQLVDSVSAKPVSQQTLWDSSAQKT